MRRWVLSRHLVAALVVAASGCDTDSIAPPPPPRAAKGTPSNATASAARAREVVLILPAEDNPDLALYEGILRNQAGLDHLYYRPLRPSPGDPPSKQAELIRRAIAEGASALIVVPDASKETADALAALDPKGVPVVILGRPLSPTPPAATLVSFEPFASAAKRLVAALVEDARADKLPADGPVLLLKATPPDESSDERDATLLDALKAAKFPVAATVAMTATDLEGNKQAVAAALKAHPDVIAVVSDDEPGVSAAVSARSDLKAAGKFLVAGYTLLRNNPSLIATGQVSALADRNVEALGRKAFAAARGRAEGKTFPAKVEIEVPLRRGGPPSAALKPPDPASRTSPAALPPPADGKK